MNICCSECDRKDVFRKRFDDTFLCYDCYCKFCCLKCKKQYKACNDCSKKLCNCIYYKVEYEYGGDLILCLSCFEKQNPEVQLYNYFKEKYNEQLTLVEIQKIIKLSNNYR